MLRDRLSHDPRAAFIYSEVKSVTLFWGPFPLLPVNVHAMIITLIKKKFPEVSQCHFIVQLLPDRLPDL